MSNAIVNAVKTLLQSSGGKFITVTFKKKDGTMRTINGRSGVTKHLVGGFKKYDEEHLRANFFTIYENGNGYRSVNYSTVTEVKMEGRVVKFA